jgi:DNA gyrase subunit B
VGISAVNALAAECSAEVAWDGYLWRQTYQAGTPVTEVMQVRPLAEDESTGTRITIQPDFGIFEPNEFDYEILANRAQEVAYLIPTLTITLRDEREGVVRENMYHFADGLSGYIKHLNRASSVIHSPFTAKMKCSIESNGHGQYTKRVEVALQYTDTMDTTIVGYANTIRTTYGSHTDYLPEALLDIINPRLSEPFSIADIMPGLTAIVSIWHPHPSFESQTNVKLINPEVRRMIAVAVEAAIPTLRNEVERLTQKLLTNRQALKEGGE